MTHVTPQPHETTHTHANAHSHTWATNKRHTCQTRTVAAHGKDADKLKAGTQETNTHSETVGANTVQTRAVTVERRRVDVKQRESRHGHRKVSDPYSATDSKTGKRDRKRGIKITPRRLGHGCKEHQKIRSSCTMPVPTSNSYRNLRCYPAVEGEDG